MGTKTYCIFSFLLFGLLLTSSTHNRQPNIVLILTDDQDTELGSLEAMPKLKKLIRDKGTFFPNMFVTTPICCCSRSTIFSGRYVHNNKAINNSYDGGCNSEFWMKTIEPTAFPVLLKKAGYKTFYSGKYLNQYGTKKAGGAKHIPPGWDWWSALIGAVYFFDYPMGVNGTKVHFGKSYEDYLTNVIRTQAKDFLKTVDSTQPFFMVLAATAPHTPADSVPPYLHKFSDRRAPRTPHYGKHASDKHWLIRSMPKEMPDAIVDDVDELFRKRWRSLQPVDDMVEELYYTLRKMKVLENTYIIYTSDNGFQLGQFNLPWDKRQLYDFDVRVPLMVRGPRVKKNVTRNEPILNLDLAPTILSMAEIAVPDYMEGMTFKGLLKTENNSPSWRKSFLVEYHGEVDQHQRCAPEQGCCLTSDPCICVDSRNNTYNCIRTISNRKSIDEVFCEIEDSENFTEYYNLRKDRYQLANQAKHLTPIKLRSLKKRLSELKQCSGKQCRYYSL